MVERILEIIKQNNLTSARFAELIDVQRSNVSHVLSGRNKPSLDFILKILEAFPEINTDWLLFGKAGMNSEDMPARAPEVDLFSDDDTKMKSDPSPIIIAPEEAENSSEQPSDDKIIPEKEVVKQISEKKLTKIMFFYSDKTFEVFNNS